MDPDKKQRIKQRQRQKARAKHAAQIGSLKGQKQAARHDYHQEIKSTRGAVNYLQNALSSAIESAKSSGLRGRYLQDVVDEFGAQMADSANIVPMAKQSARVELRDTLGGLNDQILTQRISQQNEARTAIQAALKRARQNERERTQAQNESRKERTRTVKNAHIIALNKISETERIATQTLTPPPADATASDQDAYQKALQQQQDAKNFLNDLYAAQPSAMRLLAADVASGAESVDQFEALSVIRRMFKPKQAVGRAVSSLGENASSYFGG